MSLSLHFRKAKLSAMSLAKVGNPMRNEPLRTSQALCRFKEDEAELLTHCFLKCFKSLELHSLTHHTDLEKNELFEYASAIFGDNNQLLEAGANIARHLHAKSNHPNIKSGDLCVALIDDIVVSGEATQAISIVKSESKVPFLQISERDGDLVLTTEQGIYPEKIDKGCLIINHGKADGYSIYLFDKGGGSTQFWIRDFVGAKPVTNDDYLTKRYAELCIQFAEEGMEDGALQEDRMAVASKAISYLNDTDEFDLDEFEMTALGEPDRVQKFKEYKENFEEEHGQSLKEKFSVSKKEAEKAGNRLKSKMKLDVGVTMQFSSGFVHEADRFMERGYDEDKRMEYVKIYFNSEI